MGRLEGKVALVTGGGSGIGRAICERFAREGARVAVADWRGPAAEETVARIGAEGGAAVATSGDVASPEDAARMIEETVAAFGRLDMLVANAGQALVATTTETTPEQWERVIGTNLTGCFLPVRAAIPHLIAAGGGSIVNASSNQSSSGDLSQTAYAAAKAAINTLSLSIATQFGRQGIRCNVVSPGPIRTPAFDRACPPVVVEDLIRHSLVPRLGRAEDLAHAVLFLASDEASYITGQILRVDGGQLAHMPHYAMLTSTGATTTRRS